MSYGASAYAKVSQVAMSPREAEAAVLIKAARQLQSVRDDWGNQSSASIRRWYFNQKVWTILASAATESDNPLPSDVKQGMASLSAFVFRRIIDTMADPKAEKLSALISINHNIAAGLSAR